MLRKSALALMTIALTIFCTSLSAQMVVHAMSGTVKAINPQAKTMDITIDSGDTSEFNLPGAGKVNIDFDKALESDSVNPDKFQQIGDFVVVYYYGYDNNRTAVAVKDLGKGPFEKIEGSVTNYDKHDRTMTVKDGSGKSASFVLSDHLVVDTGESVAPGRNFGPHKGDYVRVTYTTSGDKNTAVFLRTTE